MAEIRLTLAFLLSCTLWIVDTNAMVSNLVDTPPCDSKIYCNGSLLTKVQEIEMYRDSKTFVDMNMKMDPETVLKALDSLNTAYINPKKDQIRGFLSRFFEGPGREIDEWVPTDWKASPKILNKIEDDELQKFASDLNAIWKRLGKRVSEDVRTNPERYSMIYVPNPFIVPGGRFREYYYWDTFWIVRGLLLSEMGGTARGMIDNLFHLVDKYGFVPNGGRTYYERRSQPPMLIPMVEQYYDNTNDANYLRNNIDRMEREYSFWEKHRGNEVSKNHDREKWTYKFTQYAAHVGYPRPEAYREDTQAATGMNRGEAAMLYSDLASSCESGWDFSSRWLATDGHDKNELKSSRTRDIIPVDLNALLCWNENIMARFYGILGNTKKRDEWAKKAATRKKAIDDVLWDNQRGVWLDYDIKRRQHNDVFYISNIFPLMTGCYGNNTKERREVERRVFNYLKDQKVLDYPGGVPTSKIESGQQWDFPNAWPPLQYAMVKALQRMGEGLPEARSKAINLASRWIMTNYKSFVETGAMFEKYDARKQGSPGVGGEYETQAGFGWTNGVALDFLNEYGNILKSDEIVSRSSRLSVTFTLVITYLTVIFLKMQDIL